MKLNFAPGNILLPGLGKQKFDGARLEGSWNSKEDRFEIQRLRGSMKNGLRANGSGYLDNPVGSPEGSFFIEVYPLALGSWISDSATDMDGDGCRDSTEDDDDDNDNILDINDNCIKSSE